MARIAAVALLVVLVAACSASHHRVKPSPRNVTPAPVGYRWDVIGTVKRVAFSKDYKTHNKAVGMTVGPERIQLVDGRVLRVPAQTPGSNACVELLTDADKLRVTGAGPPDGLRDSAVRLNGPRNLTCVIVAALGANGVVAHFSVLDTTDKWVANKGLADAGGVVARQGDRYLTESGYAFPLDSHPHGDCTPQKVGLSKDHPNKALVDPKLGMIVEIDCRFLQ